MGLVFSKEIINAIIIVSVVVGGYFFAYKLQSLVAIVMGFIYRQFGENLSSQEYKLQRYVFQHSNGIIAKAYRWVNQQIVALGLKKQGITPFGFTLSWGIFSLIISLVLYFYIGLGAVFSTLIWLVLWICTMVMTRVLVSNRLEKREAEVMDAIDLIVPEIHNGVKNAIVTYEDKFSLGVRSEFQMFITNIQERGFSFEAAMYVLADSLGEVFQDFAEKAIYYEKMGERDLLDIFSDIVETNRLRRQLREANVRKFRELTVTFTVSSMMVFGYACFVIFTDEFSNKFLLRTTIGNLILLICAVIIFGVLAFITTLRSQKI